MEEKVIPGLIPQKNGTYALFVETSGDACVSPEVLEAVSRIARETGCLVHLTSIQKIMLLGLDMEQGKQAMETLRAKGVDFKKPKQLSQPKVCVGLPFCKLALQETFSLGRYLYKELARHPVAACFKTAVSGCPACCSSANLVDIGFVGVKDGWKVFIGGNGGRKPSFGEEMGKVTTHDEAKELVERVADLFSREMKKKARLCRIIERLGKEEFKKAIGL